MTRYPYGMSKQEYQDIRDRFDSMVHFHVEHDDLPTDREGFQASALECELKDLTMNEQKEITVHVGLPGPVDFVPTNKDDQYRLRAVAEALEEGQDVSIDGEDVDDVLGWNDD